MNGAENNKYPEVELIITASQTELTLSVSETVLDLGSYMDVPLTPTAGITYTGEYEVESSIQEQTLPTENKYLKQDVVIKPIPQSEVSNTSGGTTFYIGKEVEY